MRYVTALAGFLLIATLSPAVAQAYPGQPDVTVNPSAAGTQLLLYPGGKYGRIVRPLRMPGATNGPIHLHMPASHRLARHQTHREPVATAEPAELSPPIAQAAPAPVEQAPAPRVHARKTRVARAPVAAPVAAPPPEQSAPAASMSELGSEGLTTQPVPEAPPRHAKRAAEPAMRTATVEPPSPRTAPPRAHAPGGTPRDVVLFAPDAADPSASAVESVKALAGSLSTALSDADSRVQLVAYGGPRGTKSSDTRRLSLKRALIVRQLLIDNGVPAERIDVRAMGGVDDEGPTDRVDVFLRS